MWYFFLLILDQLENSFKWGAIGFLLGIFIIYLFRKGNILKNDTFFQVVRNSIYYIIYPIGLASLFWLFAATKHVEKDAYDMLNTSINKTEEGLYGMFNKYVTQNLSSYIDLNHVPTNDEIVSDFLNETEHSGWFKKKVMHWSLVHALEIAEKKALTQMGINPDNEELTVLLLANDEHRLEQTMYHMPFKQLKGFTFNTIKSYLRGFYISYYIGYGILIFFLILPLVISLFSKF